MAAEEVHLRCVEPNFYNLQKFNEDGITTLTSDEQIKVEESIQHHHEYIRNMVEVDPLTPKLHRDRHIHYLKKGLVSLSESYQCLDASRPWLCYWILHALSLLDEPVSEETKSSVAKFLDKCQCEDGGFAGGPGQMAHLAPTYAAVNALCILGTEEAYQVIDRIKLQKFLIEMKQPDGSFTMHRSGEVDIRGAYCALAAAQLTNICVPEMFEQTANWISECQTYEGGFGGAPGMEAHGGYTFCGFASLVLLGEESACDVMKLLRWLVNKQMRFEGGFQGRTNKLVDGCYSFWQGGVFPLLHRYFSTTDREILSMEKWLFHQTALQEYLLLCCQDTKGGLIDKPGKNRDFYHTCYTLSGLSVAQHFAGGILSHKHIVGDPKNELVQTHPVYNICLDAAFQAEEYFKTKPIPSTDQTTRQQSQ